jgi:hypothetical protein
MTEEQYILLSPYKNDLNEWCVKQSNVNTERLRAIGAIYYQLFPNAKPINYSCRACVNEFMNLTFNVLRSYESTIS